MEGPWGTDLVPTATDWSAWAGLLVTRHFGLVSCLFCSPGPPAGPRGPKTPKRVQGRSSQNHNPKKNALCFLNFFDLSDRTEISVKNGVWGPVEWVGDQLTGWEGSSQKQNSKINGFFFISFDLRDGY